MKKSLKYTKLSLFLIKHHDMKAYGALYGGELAASRSGRFTSQQRAICSLEYEGLVGPSLNDVQKGRMSRLCQESNPDS
jgi:hypothetical protein